MLHSLPNRHRRVMDLHRKILSFQPKWMSISSAVTPVTPPYRRGGGANASTSSASRPRLKFGTCLTQDCNPFGKEKISTVDRFHKPPKIPGRVLVSTGEDARRRAKRRPPWCLRTARRRVLASLAWLCNRLLDTSRLPRGEAPQRPRGGHCRFVRLTHTPLPRVGAAFGGPTHTPLPKCRAPHHTTPTYPPPNPARKSRSRSQKSALTPCSQAVPALYSRGP